MQNLDYKQLDDVQKRLMDAAVAAMDTPYSPYSKFHVGAALLAQNGTIIPGSNVENAAYGSTICAERGAIMHANAQKIRTFYKIAIIGKGESFETPDVVSPCGSCRQMLNESAQVSQYDLEVIMSNTRMDKIVIASMSELLPLAFGPTNIGIDISKYR